MSDLADAVRPHVDDALAGDRKARGRIWRAIEPFIRAVAASVLPRGRFAELDDVVQDLSLKLLVGKKPKIAGYKPPLPLKPWLATVVVRAVWDGVRAAKRRQAAESAFPPASGGCDGPVEAAERNEIALLVDRAIAGMSPTDQVMLRAIRDDDVTHEEAARRAKRGPQAVQRAKRRLSERLPKSLGDKALGDRPAPACENRESE